MTSAAVLWIHHQQGYQVQVSYELLSANDQICRETKADPFFTWWLWIENSPWLNFLRTALKSKTLPTPLPSCPLFLPRQISTVSKPLSTSPLPSPFSLREIFPRKFLTLLILPWHQLLKGPEPIPVHSLSFYSSVCTFLPKWLRQAEL